MQAIDEIGFSVVVLDWEKPTVVAVSVVLSPTAGSDPLLPYSEEAPAVVRPSEKIAVSPRSTSILLPV